MPYDTNSRNPAITNGISPSCPRETELLRYLESSLNESETAQIEYHLEDCAACFDLLAVAFQNQTHLPTEKELAETGKLFTRTTEQKVAKITRLAQKIYPVPPSPNFLEKLWEKVLPFFHRRERTTEPAWAWPRVVAFASLLLALAGWRGWQYFQTGYQIAQATELLQAQHRVYIKDARLSGGYGSSGISVLMGEEEEQSYLEQARARVEKAFASGEQSVKAKQLLAQLFMIEKEYPRADSVLRTLASAANNSPALLNDLGVYYFQRQDWANAEKYFLEAITVDPKFREARYNLALVKMQQGAKDEANAILNEYLQIEKDENWQNAARGLQDDLRE